MTSQPLDSNSTPLESIRRQYGPVCPNCKRVIPIGADDIEPNVDIATFRERLRRLGYKPPEAVCLYRGCGHRGDARLHLIHFGLRDDILPTRETFQ